MGKSLRFLRFFAFLFVVIFTSNAFSAGYDCPEYKKYISCTSGYYLSDCGTDSANWNGHQVVSSPATGNTCIECPTGYDCSGGAACPSKKKITCSPGYYLPAYSTSCSECGGPGYYCPGGSFVSMSSSAQGRNPVRTGYYSTGGTPTTRTGQSQCTGATYCTGGVQYNCPSEQEQGGQVIRSVMRKRVCHFTNIVLLVEYVGMQ